jgi:pimeloyl-ACP methyl ester carboxylesterase
MITLVLLPGMDGTGLLFADFISALGPEFEARVITYPDDPSLGYNELEEIVRSFLPQDRPFAVLAESFSGPIAISIAASEPPGLFGLVLCCSFARNPRPLFAPAEILLKFFPVKLVPMAVLNKYLLGRWTSTRLRSALRGALAKVSSNTLRARAKAVTTTDVSAKLRQLRIPVLYLRATDDLLVTRTARGHILQTAPHVQVAELEGPHLLLQTSPSPAAATVGNFLRSAIESPNRS